MYVVTEQVCQQVFNRQDAFDAVESVFAAMASGDAYNFPVVREALGYQDALYGFKAGFDRKGSSLGLKAGGYWPHNAAKGLTNHQSSVFLFDADTGRLVALVGGNYLTAIRTAAASAVSIAHLARRDATVIGMLGAGHQASFQLRAALAQRQFEKVIGWNLHPADLSRLSAVAEEAGLPFAAVEREQLAAESDVLITITSAHEALLMNAWLKPGLHLACMGTDTAGKQEIDPRIFANAAVFTDDISQAVSLGECQHAVARGIICAGDITAIGEVINGTHPGRTRPQQITVFDGTGAGLQDLAVAAACVRAAIARDRGLTVEL